MNLTLAYEKICDIIVHNPSIVTPQDLQIHMQSTNINYTLDDINMAYSWAMQAVKRVIVHNFGQQALHP